MQEWFSLLFGDAERPREGRINGAAKPAVAVFCRNRRREMEGDGVFITDNL
jgi:hypothetical protein